MRGIKILKRTSKKGVYCSGGIGGSEYYEFEIGKRYKTNNEPALCQNGFHFFRYKDFVFGYDFYSCGDKNTVYVEIESYGSIDKDTMKCCSCEIEIIRIIYKKEWSKWIRDGKNNSGNRNSGNRNSGNRNSGDWNSGYRNSGDNNSGNWNSGDRNSGYRNSGDWNSGDNNSGYSNSGNWNSGDWNSGDRNSGDNNSGYRNSGDNNSGNWNSGNWNSGDNNSGFLNCNRPKGIRVFNKFCSAKRWEKCKKPDWLYFNQTKGKCYKESAKIAFNNTTEADKKLTKKLPNFNMKIFKKIFGFEF